MSASSSALRAGPKVLADAFSGSRAGDLTLVVGFACFVGLTAQVAIPLPFTPVPITGQTFGVLLGGMALGWRRAAAGMVLYTIVGLAGFPWFAQAHGGLALLGAPSFGYILGFIAAAIAVGRLAEARFDRNPLLTLAAMVAGNCVIYLFGVGWLAVTLRVGLRDAVALGLVPFLLGDAIKALLAAGLMPGAWRLAGRRSR